MDAVIAQVAHSAEDDRLREMVGPLGIAGPQLTQQGDQGIADQGVDLVEEEDGGPGVGSRSIPQGAKQTVTPRHLMTSRA